MDLTYLLDRALAAHSAAEDAVHTLFGYTDGNGAAVRDRRDHFWWSDYDSTRLDDASEGFIVYAESAEAVTAYLERSDHPRGNGLHGHRICAPPPGCSRARFWLSEDGQHIMFRLLAADGSRYLGVFRVSARVT